MASDIKRLFKHSWIYTVGNVLNRIGAFILLPLYTNHLRVAEYGTLELFYSIKMIIASMLSIGLAHATLRFYFEYDNDQDKKEIVGTALISTSILAVPFIFILSFWNVPIAEMVFGDAKYASLLNLIYMILIVELSEEVGQAYIRAKEYSIVYVMVNLLQLILQVGCSYYLVALKDKGITGVLTGNLVSMLTGWSIVTFVAVRECGLHFSLGKLKRIVHYSYPFLFASVTSVVINNADRFILKSFSNMENVGHFSLAMKFGMLLQVLFLEPFNRSFGAFRFSIMKQENVKQMLSDILSYRVLGLLLLGMGIIVFSKPVIQVMTAKEYWAAHDLLPYIILAGSISGLTYVFQTGILYEKKTKFMMYITVFTGVLTLISNFILIPMFDAYGAVYSQILMACIGAFVTWWVSHKIYPIQWDYKKLFKMYGCAAFVIALFLSVSISGLYWVIVVGVITMALFVALLYYLGCIEKGFLSKTEAMVLSKIESVVQMFKKSVKD